MGCYFPLIEELDDKIESCCDASARCCSILDEKIESCCEVSAECLFSK